jgi:hypothetical protein
MLKKIFIINCFLFFCMATNQCNALQLGDFSSLCLNATLVGIHIAQIPLAQKTSLHRFLRNILFKSECKLLHFSYTFDDSQLKYALNYINMKKLSTCLIVSISAYYLLNYYYEK